MLGTIINSVAIVLGSVIGLLIKNLNLSKFNDTIIKGLSLCVIIIGISGALKGTNMLLIIFSVVIGGIIGEIIDIDLKLKDFGMKIEERFKGKYGKVSEGFITATLIYCVGAMAVVGALESGLTGNHKTLFAKSVLDGVTAIIFSSSLGIGVMFSAVSVFIYQGTITIGASLLKGVLVGNIVNEMSAVGGLLIIGIGLNIMEISKIKVANLLPAMFIPLIYQMILHILGK